MSEKVERLFNDIITKMSIYENIGQKQEQIDIVFTNLSNDVRELSLNFSNFETLIEKSINSVEQKIDKLDSEMKEVSNLASKVNKIDLWKNEIDKYVTVNDFKNMKNKYSDIKNLELKINDLNKTIIDEIRKDINELKDDLNDTQTKERLVKLETLVKEIQKKSFVAGGGAGAGISGAIVLLANIMKG